MAQASRFEVLEETTHYPEAPGEEKFQNSNEFTEERVETLEEKLEQLTMDNETDVKKSSSAKELGNKYFSDGKYLGAIECYTTALKLCPSDEEYSYNRAVYFSNRSACFLRLGRPEEAIEDASQSIELAPNYVKPLLRRSEAHERLEQFDEALKDLDDVLKIDPTIKSAVESHRRVKQIVDERTEKMKAEMLDKLKGFGNTILGKFGLSTDNFQMVQDPATGSYSINFSQNPQQQNP